MKKSLFALVLVSALALTAPAQAGIIKYDVLLNGANDQNGSTATGEALLTLDDVANTLDLALTFTGLSANATAAHIHCCIAPPANAPVVLPFPTFPVTTSGTYTHSFTITATLAAGIEAGLAYVNIHDSLFPGGEIRGNITAQTVVTPEPATMALFGFSLTCLALVRRKRK